MGICVSCRRRERKAPEKRWVPGAGGYAKGAAADLLPRRVHLPPLPPLPAMANSISNIKMTNPIKGIVSRRRKRYKQDGFDLDLAYITDRLIAMGFPAEKLEGVYRNHIDEVYRFLEQKHKDHYKIYNLCSERKYDAAKFHKRVSTYAFEDHTPPNINLIRPFCEDVHNWLSADSRNVAAVHCKAGKGRTGTMVCCYLLYSGQKATADEALKFYGTKRAHDEKGVTIPSQRRYVEYFAALVRSGASLQYRSTKLHIRELLMSPPPALNGGQCTLELTVAQADPPFKKTLAAHEVRRSTGGARVLPAACTPLHGDVRVDVYCKPKMMRKERLFHFWFNTFFVAAGVGSQRVPPPPDSPNLETFKLTLNKWQLDDAHKDKQNKIYSPDFKVELVVQKQPESSTFSGHPGRAPSPPSTASSSCSEPDTEHDADPDHDHDTDAHWDSGSYPYRPLRCGAVCRCRLHSGRYHCRDVHAHCRCAADAHHVSADPLHVSPDPLHVSPDPLHVSPDPLHVSPDPHHGSPEPHDVTTDSPHAHVAAHGRHCDVIADSSDARHYCCDGDEMNFGSFQYNGSNAKQCTGKEEATRYERKMAFDYSSDVCSCRDAQFECGETLDEFDTQCYYDGRASKASSKSCNYPERTVLSESKIVYDDANQQYAHEGKNTKVTTDPDYSYEGKIPKVSSDHALSDEKTKVDERTFTKPRLSLGDMRASWREFSGKFGENRKKKNREDC